MSCVTKAKIFFFAFPELKIKEKCMQTSFCTQPEKKMFEDITTNLSDENVHLFYLFSTPFHDMNFSLRNKVESVVIVVQCVSPI